MEEQVRRAILEKARELPALPAVVVRIIEIAADERSSAADVGEAIRADHVLSARLVKLVNSAFYGLRHKVSSIPHAVALIGFRALRNLLLTIGVHDALLEGSRKGGLDKPLFWQHSIAVGATSGRIAAATGAADPSEAYTAGLLHDIGKVVLDRHMKEGYFKVLSNRGRERSDPIELERIVLGTTHPEVGALVAARWNFPETLIDAIGRHHDASLAAIADERSRRLAALVAVADSVCWDHGFPSHDWQGRPRVSAEVLSLLDMRAVSMARLVEEVEAELNRASQVFGLAPARAAELHRSLEEANRTVFVGSSLHEQLRADLDGRSMDLSLVGQVVADIRTIPDYQEAIAHLLGLVAGRLRFDRVFYFDLSTAERTLRLIVSHDRGGLHYPDNGRVLHLRGGAGPIEECALLGKPFLLSLDDAEPGVSQWRPGGREMGGVPLAVGPEVRGVLVVDNTDTGSPVTRFAVETLHLLAREVGGVLQAREAPGAATAERTALGLQISTECLRLLAEATRRARLGGGGLTALLVEMEGLGRFADRAGVQAAEALLAGAGEILEEAAAGRPGGFAGWLAAERFLVVLPGADLSLARTVAGDLERRVSAYADSIASGGDSLIVALTGVALFDPATDSGETLLERASEDLEERRARRRVT